MTYSECEIKAICEVTGDSKELVSAVLILMRKLLVENGVDCQFMDEQIPQDKVEIFIQSIKSRKGLIPWYERGLHFYDTLCQQNS